MANIDLLLQRFAREVRWLRIFRYLLTASLISILALPAIICVFYFGNFRLLFGCWVLLAALGLLSNLVRIHLRNQGRTDRESDQGAHAMPARFPLSSSIIRDI